VTEELDPVDPKVRIQGRPGAVRLKTDLSMGRKSAYARRAGRIVHSPKT
jgi:hypothetical protein